MTTVSHSDAATTTPAGRGTATDCLPRHRFRAGAAVMIGALSMIVPALLAPRLAVPQAVPQAAAQSRSAAQGGSSVSSTVRSADERGVSGTLVGARVTLVARPQDSNRAITAVRFLLDGQTLAEVGPPGQYVWNTSGLRLGRHVVQVQGFSGESFVGISPPLALIVTATDSSTVVPVSFPTYGFSARRASSIVAPRLGTDSGAGILAEGGDAARASNYGTYIEPVRGLDELGFVEVYLNGVKQEFAPAPRVASAEELEKVASQQAASQRSTQSAPATRNAASSRRAGAAGRHGRQQAAAATNPGLAVQGAGRTVWMPARPLLERLGARVRWEPRSKTLTADLNVAGGTRRILLSAPASGSSAYAEVNGRRVALQMPVRLAENAIMVPLTFCTDALNLRATWQKENRRVELYTPITPA